MNQVGAGLSLWWGLPMAGILLSIALLPLIAKHFWEKWFAAVGAVWALLFVVPGIFSLGFGFTMTEVLHVIVVDYVPFILLLGALFVISGGIVISGPFRGTTKSNVALLLAGAACASVIGTTGASMLFIRPLLRANQHRRFRAHTVVFFIFMVSNVGGSLTPLGDPPLFLGFLRGVPFFWTTTHLLFPTAFLLGGLAAVYAAIDVVLSRREAAAGVQPPAAEQGPVALRVEGLLNVLLLFGVAVVVMLSGALATYRMFVQGEEPRMVHFGPVHVPLIAVCANVLMLLLLVVSLVTTPRERRVRNEFSWAPLEEVALLFISIFVTMVPVILMLKAGTEGAFGPLIERVRAPLSYFWVTGSLSAFLDNAPSYVVFFESARSTPMADWAARGAWGSVDPVDPAKVAMPSVILAAISAGAVFMGAMTYIGNGPNFMVRSIAERSGITMPSFFGYMFKWSIPFLLPLIAVMTWLFLSGS
jgi:Na+/H+ antiporter NhaD/arsenite permease-like protein